MTLTYRFLKVAQKLFATLRREKKNKQSKFNNLFEKSLSAEKNFQLNTRELQTPASLEIAKHRKKSQRTTTKFLRPILHKSESDSVHATKTRFQSPSRTDLDFVQGLCRIPPRSAKEDASFRKGLLRNSSRIFIFLQGSTKVLGEYP